MPRNFVGPGLLPIGAYVFSRDCSDETLYQAYRAKDYMGDLVQICDAARDDGELINTAINNVISNGDRVMMSAGNFYPATDINLASGVTLQGMGDATVIVGLTGLTEAVIKIPDNTAAPAIRDMYISANHLPGISCIYIEEDVTRSYYVTLENLRLMYADDSVACYGILIDKLFTSSFRNIYIYRCANGIFWNDQDNAGSGNSSLDQIYMTLNTDNGVGLQIQRSSHFAIRRIQVNGTVGITGITGIKLYGAHDCVFTEYDIEVVKDCVVVDGSAQIGVDASQDNIFVGGYLHSGENDGAGIRNTANALRTKFYGVTLDGTNGGTSIGIDDDLASGPAGQMYHGSFYDNVHINSHFDTDWSLIAGCTARVSNQKGTELNGINDFGYLTSGEKRVAVVALTGAAQNVIDFAWQNPHSNAILIDKVVIDATTPSTLAASLDVGFDADGTGAGTDFFDDVPIDVAATYDSTIVGDAGQQTTGVLKMVANGGANDWITGMTRDASGAGLVGFAYIYYTGV